MRFMDITPLRGFGSRKRPIGFSEGQVEFQAKPKSKPTLSPVVQQQAHETARTVTDQNLRRALEELGRNVLTKNQTKNTPH